MTVEKIDNWTPDYVMGLTESEVTEAVRKVGTSFRGMERSKAKTMIGAAYAAHAALALGTSLNDLRVAWGNENTADGKLPGATMTLCKRLGICAVVLNITPDTEPDAWKLLSGKAGANVGIVGDAIEPKSPGKDANGKKIAAPAPDRQAVLDALQVAFDPSGKKRTTAEIKAIVDPEGSGEAPSDSDAADQNTAPRRSIEAVVGDAIAVLLRDLPQVGDDQWAGVYDGFAKVVEVFDAEVERRAPKSKKSA